MAEERDDTVQELEGELHTLLHTGFCRQKRFPWSG